MSNYRRVKIEGAWYFFTVVTYKRRCFLTDDTARPILKDSLHRIQKDRPFEISAFCLLPDHLQCIWKLPNDDVDYSIRWGLVKEHFQSAILLRAGG